MGDLQAYLKKRYGAAQRYGAANDSKQLKPKKKKKADKKPPACQGVKIVDDDVVWHRKIQEDSESEGEEEAPAVVENLEVTRMMKMEELRHRPYLAIGDDGSGWVDVSQGQDPPKKTEQKDDSPDLSPARERARHDTPDLSPPRQRGRHDSRERPASSDLSPPRGRHDSPDLSPPRERRGRQASPDQSLARKRDRRDSPDLSPPRQRRGKQASPVKSPVQKRDSPDLSPPRQRRGKQASPDLSPPRPRQRKGRQVSPDQSPVLQRGRDLSPPRRGARHDSPDQSAVLQRGRDLSPPRRRARHDSADLSPARPRRGRHDSPDPSPARRRVRHDSPDPTPARQRARHDSPDLSPPREGRRGRRDSPDISPPRKQNVSRRNLSPPPKTKKTALKTGAELMDEINQQKLQEAKRIKELDASVTGRGAETVYRDKHGRRLEGLEELMKQQQGRAKPAEQPLEWGTGLAQKRKFEKSQQELEEEKNKPFARSKDDPDLDKLLKNRIRWGDPMAHLVKNDDMLLEDFGKSETLKESGFIVPQEIPAHSWLKRGHPAAPNRYQIRPGRHWDGVDRSNGFEADLFKHQNEKKANQDEAYRWSVADM